MGDMVSIGIGAYDFLSYKNTFGDLLTPFCMADLHIETDTIVVKPSLNVSFPLR